MKRFQASRWSLVAATSILATFPAGASAQATSSSVPERPEAAPQDTLTRSWASPGGAFLRSMIIPGWGHAAVGAYARGGFYFAAESGTAWMLFKTLRFLDSAREKRTALEEDLVARLEAEGVSDPDSVAARLDEDEALQDAESLVRAREEQREDWLALGIFLLLVGGADAFVSSHLADFPQPVELNTTVAPGARRVEIGVSVPWKGPGG